MLKTTQNSILSVLFQSAISLILLVLTGIIVGILMIPKEVPKNSGNRTIVDTVEAVPIERHHGGIDFKIDGEVIPFRQLDIVPEITGRIVYKSDHCRLGHSVQTGETLLRIDPTDYALEVEQLTEALEQAKVNLTENTVQIENTEKELELATQQLELRKRDWERNQVLAQRNAISAAELDTAQSSLLSAEETIQKLNNQLRIYETQKSKLAVAIRKEEIALKTAKLNLERTEVKAPINGVVTSDSFEVNSFVQRGTSVAKILDTSQLEIQCSLYMKQIQWIWRQAGTENGGYVFPPTPVTILYEIDGEHWAWEGTLKTLDGGSLNAITRMVPCRVKVDDPQAVRSVHDYRNRNENGKTENDRVENDRVENDRVENAKTEKDRVEKSRVESSRIENKNSTQNAPPTLFSGMYVSIIVHSKPAVLLYRIPEKALLPGNTIWTATNSKLHRHKIRVATTIPDGVLFYADSEELSPNDLVVVSPLAAPVEGGNVHVINTGTKNVVLK
ncbi:MAG: HlyD family efflux transporter periplasmic adaptor subunit [Planctomycetaceae bacterium]|jgi:multidrug efflux pump subunit AcrA (membrane-fusion protein)|nr:HlyD family efflux transporter periplasmic adaptor subunit [Planctomycetaceae bacterium]